MSTAASLTSRASSRYGDRVSISHYNNHAEAPPLTLSGHAGRHALAVAEAHGVGTLWTLSGAHVFPLYDAAVQSESGTRIVDVRHEQTAVFGAEATAKLTRDPGMAVLTAGPGVTNGVSGVAQAHFSGVPLLALGGRAPATRWGTGALQELDHPPVFAPITKYASTAATAGDVAGTVDHALATARSAHRGPVFVDVPMDELYSHADTELAVTGPQQRPEPDPAELSSVAGILATAQRPVVVLGSDVWLDGAEQAARRFADETGIPVITNGMGRGLLPSGHRLLVNRARSTAFGRADVVLVVGTPLDFRLGFGTFGGGDGAAPARVVHLADSPAQLTTHVELAAHATGDLSAVLDGVLDSYTEATRHVDHGDWTRRLHDQVSAALERDRALLTADADPIHPARVYGELNALLDDDAVIIGDGGDFVSWAGKFIEPGRPGCWLDPGPYGCLGAGVGAAAAARLARPDSQVVLLYGDGAAGMSLMDVDTLVRHGLPVVMIVGNNGAWGLEKHPMRFLYGYDVAADLRAQTGYDDVVRALGGAGETVTAPGQIAPALRRAFDSGVPYLVNVQCDPEIAYPRSTTGI
ncbi:acetolactate synthase-1/2/3 large subunit [Haloactinopolyspora alba]|uniref:Acetolactate synthase-1/2/3 large subunit n=1 Tax=Haloactinopolyspora alba TaxID=648780 RepID=A0A2P8EB22_9ACTN|nr:acetolactate synthase-1/2/3 large subunit [Haloactinopolyspora alba]